MREIIFRLAIPAEQFRLYYEGVAKGVVVSLEDGRKLQFPATNLRRFLTHEGIYGRFRLRYNDQNKLESLEKIGD